MGEMVRRAIQAALLRRETYRQASEDPEAILKSLGIVVLAAILFGLGLMNVVVEGTRVPQIGSVVDRLISLWLVVVTTLLGWILWSFIVHLLGGKFLGGKATFQQTLRVLGVCYGPGALLIFVRLPGVGSYAVLMGLLWILVAGIVAMREVQRIDWVGAVLPTLIGWAIFLILMPALIVIPNVE